MRNGGQYYAKCSNFYRSKIESKIMGYLIYRKTHRQKIGIFRHTGAQIELYAGNAKLEIIIHRCTTFQKTRKLKTKAKINKTACRHEGKKKKKNNRR